MIRIIAAAALGLAAGAAQAEDVAYEVDGTALEGYFAAAAEPKGLVVIVHDWDGVGDYERKRADMLAELGYDAFALDVYGAGVRPDTVDGRMAAMKAAFSDPGKLRALVLGGIEEAGRHSKTDDVVLIGYCFGGAVTLATARAGAPVGVAGFATFHAGIPGGEATWPQDSPPVLILHGGADKTPALADVAAFVAGMEASAVPYEIQVYSGAPHAFTVFGSENYRERADQESWAALQRFLGERLPG
ncbi:dienelactone hydrolase family protein [Amaricoccus sp.]|uniref:dienelactone hydrolase family protein n=1 Tax=Amaricoccus sp. TaxID=1872485 RepID=UPI001B6405F2|nr:dienelactone hydrolase family protein [Amaricoccus sp.]MBP7002064.1 dienelactone hydrolase family protein [Amaricoccus sp.]